MVSRRALLVTAALHPLAPVNSIAGAVASDWSPMPAGLVSRVAFGSCALQWEPQPIWTAISAAHPDLFLFLGDNIYADWHGGEPFDPTRESLDADYAKLAAIPEFAAFRAHVPVMATWDNHDYGRHDGGENFEFKEMTKATMLDFFGELPGSARRKRGGIYDVQIFGPPGKRIQIILLDNRWYRDVLIPDERPEAERAALGLTGSMGLVPNPDRSATLLGELQWRWLEYQLRQPAEVRLVCSGTQIVNDTKGMQEWGNFPHERLRLFELISSTGAHGVVFLSGNVHYSEVCRTEEGPYPLVDFTSSGMTHNNEAYAEFSNPFRVAGPCTTNNFGLVDIDWESTGGPSIYLSIMKADGSTHDTFQFDLADLA